jgi:hypothetical protein
MRAAFIVLICVLIGRSCDSGVEPAVPQGEIKTTFSLADTLGSPRTMFHISDRFDFKFSITNLTPKAQTFHITGPMVIFEIRQGDSTLATSVDGLAWIMVYMTGSIPSGGSESQAWRGPKPPGGDPAFGLTPGHYSARARLRYEFGDVRISPTPDSPFVMLP